MNINQLKIELAINEAQLREATSIETIKNLLVQRATLKDMLIEALTEALTKAA